mgnify:CR=1 FL=1
MKIIIESHIPFINGIFEPYAQVEYLAPEHITADAVRDADALIVRTRTRCNAALLDNSRCRVIATATIGTDHIDLDYCAGRGIQVFNAPGCNAPAVAQYVLSAIAPAQGKTIGIVGVGHVGRIVEAWAKELGMTVLLNDPPRQEAEHDCKFTDLATIAKESDIITFHTPLVKSGKWATVHLADKAFFNSLERKPIIINAARGPIVDTEALIHALENGQVSKAVIDCWENEPDISARLLELVHVGTPHIAGYSIEGKRRATAAAVNAVAKALGLPAKGEQIPDGVHVDNLSWDKIRDSYNPLTDTAALRHDPTAFESLRNHYNLRHEP